MDRIWPPKPPAYQPILQDDVHPSDEAHAPLLPPHDSSRQSAAAMYSDKESEAGLSYVKPGQNDRAMSRRAKWITAATSTATFGAGVLACLAIQAVVIPGGPFRHVTSSSSTSPLGAAAQLDAGGQDAVGSGTGGFHYPPASPTNAGYATYFPTNVGYAGPTPTGEEAGLIQTGPAYPVHTGAANLVAPSSLGGTKSKGGKFDIFKNWGNLTPWYSVPSSAFGLPGASPDTPETCQITGLHFLHRHGARYPTSSKEGPERFKDRLDQLAQQGKKWTAFGDLAFLNTWTYHLGNELLTPFGRQQMYDLGVNLRIKYGFLLDKFTDALPVFRTESQDRMLHSAQNFAVGFFGYPIEGQYYQSVTYETSGVNNTLAPYMTCTNANAVDKAYRGNQYVTEWVNTYLKKAANRLQRDLDGIDLAPADMYNFQQICAYETVALGYSKFCELFTEEEWEGFAYALDLSFWYNSAFGSPVARTQGIGYIQELIARLTHTKIPVHNSSTNSTLDDNDITFPLNQPLYVDATHEVVVLNILTALNLTSLARTGPLPSSHIPKNRSFQSGQLAPFGTNVQFQLLSCEKDSSATQIRVIVNDGVVPLTGIEGCPESKDGLCPLDTFVAAQKKIIAETDWNWACYGNWTLPAGDAWTTVTGDAPAKP